MNEGRVRRSEQAKRDLIEQAWHIAQDSVDAAERFLAACEEAFDTLVRMPEMGVPREFRNPRLEGLRMWPVRGFEKHLVFYQPLADGIRVVRVLHGARDIEGILESE